MQIQHQFKNVDSSESVCQYFENRIERLERHLIQKFRCVVKYSQEGHQFQVWVELKSPGHRFSARSQADSWMSAIDDVMDRLDHQALKYKDRVQSHKKYERSKQGRMDRVNELLEFDMTLPIKKAG